MPLQTPAQDEILDMLAELIEEGCGGEQEKLGVHECDECTVGPIL